MRFLPFIVLTGASLLPLKAVAASETTGDPITNPPTTPMPKEAVTSDSTESGNLPTTDPAPPAEPPTTSTTTVSTPTTTQRETTQPTAPTPRTTSPTPEATQGHKAVSIDCLKEANEVREKIGFSAFKGPTGDEQKLPIEGIIASASTRGTEVTDTSATGKKTLNDVCKVILEKTKEGLSTEDQTKGVYMYASQTTSSGDCAKAVEYWKEGQKNFTSKPPAYSTTTDDYANNQNVSFVGLYNPGQNPTLDCAFITCQPSTDEVNKASALQQQQQPEPEGGSGTSKNPIYSIICLSTPQALKNNQEPFTQEEWNQITGVGNNSTIPTVFAALTLAAAAFMHALF